MCIRTGQSNLCSLENNKYKKNQSIFVFCRCSPDSPLNSVLAETKSVVDVFLFCFVCFLFFSTDQELHDLTKIICQGQVREGVTYHSSTT